MRALEEGGGGTAAGGTATRPPPVGPGDESASQVWGQSIRPPFESADAAGCASGARATWKGCSGDDGQRGRTSGSTFGLAEHGRLASRERRGQQDAVNGPF